MKMYDVIAVADSILRIAKSRNVQLTPLQLMKLVYIAHGWHLAEKGRDLFNNRIEAWKYGPVMPELYRATKGFGNAPIPFDLIVDKEEVIDDDTLRFLTGIFDRYGNKSGYSLSSLTHQNGTPWHKVYIDGHFGLEIPDELIKEHYLELLNARDNTNRAA